jgi:hypothetical protein
VHIEQHRLLAERRGSQLEPSVVAKGVRTLAKQSAGSAADD